MLFDIYASVILKKQTVNCICDSTIVNIDNAHCTKD